MERIILHLELITQGKKEFQYGRVDIRALLPKGQGIWPALWMLGANVTTVGWPACGEIDIMGNDRWPWKRQYRLWYCTLG
jgi:beta-glucanase (GH16 family)